MLNSLFARVYDRRSASNELAGAAAHRCRLLGGLTGRVLEVGAGNGLNFGHYPPTVTSLVAVEPQAFLRRRAKESAGRTSTAITLTSAKAEALPLLDHSFDAVVTSLVLCSVEDVPGVLGEVWRVLRPGGELRFYEHVRAQDDLPYRHQRWADPVWSQLMGGCHLTRDTATAIAAAGFTIEACDGFMFHPNRMSRLAAPHILGVARRPPS